jgi:cell wall-associated NlpC family hydrolase
MIHIDDVVALALAQQGDRYDNTLPTNVADPDPDHFDCSGLVRWSCARAGLTPLLPWSAYLQAQLCVRNNTAISVDEAIATRGALLFRFPGIDDVMTLRTRPEGAHVAWSLGDGKTMEAAGRTRPVGIFGALNRDWTHGGRVPGAEYSTRLPTPPPPNNTQKEDDVSKIIYFSGPSAGEAHPYLVSGVTGKHLSQEALDLHGVFGTEVVGSPDKPCGKAWQDAVAILDGPLRNIA